MLKELPYAVFFDICEPVLPDNKQTKKMTNMGLDSSQNEAFRLSFLEKEKKVCITPLGNELHSGIYFLCQIIFHMKKWIKYQPTLFHEIYLTQVLAIYFSVLIDSLACIKLFSFDAFGTYDNVNFRYISVQEIIH